MDLFNNIPLMRFMCSDEAGLLCEHGMLRVICPNEDNFQNIFHDWAFSKSGQHFHHLDSGQQASYDEACRSGKLNSPEQAEDWLHFSRYGVNLADNLSKYDYLFKGQRETLGWNPPAEDYPKKVLEHWQGFLEHPHRTAHHSRETIKKIDAEVSRGAREGWRRRQFFTNLERLEQAFACSAQDLALVRDVKLTAVNKAFYDELELMRYSEKDPSAPIWVTRDHSLISRLPHSNDVEPLEAEPPSIERTVEPIHAIPLECIIGWHTEAGASHPELKAFQDSVRELDNVLSGEFSRYPANEIDALINRHIDILNRCVEKTIKDQGLQIEQQRTIIKAFVPKWGRWIKTGLNAALLFAAEATGHTQLGILMTAAFDIMLEFETKTPGLVREEAILRNAMESQIMERVELTPPLTWSLRP
jgi:hypothetical protein